MRLTIIRDTYTSKSTIGRLFIDGVEFCYTLEDIVRPEGIKVYGETGKKVDAVELSEGVFNSSVDELLVHRSVVMQRASTRQGNASTKGRGEVRGSGKKPWKQKHTGRARAGSAGSPIWRHGGTVFGPKPRSYAFPLPKKAYRAALRAALTDKAAAGDLIVVDLSLPEMKMQG